MGIRPPCHAGLSTRLCTPVLLQGLSVHSVKMTFTPLTKSGRRPIPRFVMLYIPARVICLPVSRVRNTARRTHGPWQTLYDRIQISKKEDFAISPQ
jgi:hypothetical protein